MRSISPYERYGQVVPITDATLQVHVFITTDTISNLAEKYFGDWRLWRLIAERNSIVDVRTIAPGTKLIIPTRELKRGRFESL